jgi:phosphoribosylanthranilate isomerase
MTLKTKVLVTNITNLSEARYCAGMGVQLLAFPINLVDPQLFHDITGWVQGPKMVLDISNATEIPSNISDYPADFILINSQQQLASSLLALPIILRINSASEIGSVDPRNISYLIVTGKNENEITQLTNDGFKVMLSVPGNISGLDDWLQLPIEGIALAGDKEEKPGLKNYDHLAVVLEGLERGGG